MNLLNPRFLSALVAMLGVAASHGAGLKNGEVHANSQSLIEGETTNASQMLDMGVNTPLPPEPGDDPVLTPAISNATLMGSMSSLDLAASASMTSLFVQFFSNATSQADFRDALTINAEGIDPGTDLRVEVTWNVAGQVNFNSSSQITTRAKIFLLSFQGESWTRDLSNFTTVDLDPTGEVSFTYVVKAGTPVDGNIFLRAVAGVACGGPGSNYFGSYFSAADADLSIDFVGVTSVKTMAGSELYRWDTSSVSGLVYGSRDEDPPQLPDINLQGNGLNIANGDTSPSPDDHTDFDVVDANGPALTRTFTIQNTGLTTLGVSSVQIIGGDSSQFSITADPPGTIIDGMEATFEVTYDPDEAGTHTTTIRINNDDIDESPYEFTIQGVAIRLDPEIEVQGAGMTISPGDFNPSVDDDTEYGQTTANGAGLTHTFTIKNNGDGVLNLLKVELFNGDTDQFVITSPPDASIAVGAESTFNVQYDPDEAGSHFTSVFIESNDPIVPFYEFDIQGSAVALAPQITVEGAGMTIAPSDFTPSLADDTDFGEVQANGPGLAHTFTIKNGGNAELTIITLDLFNGDPSQFAVTSQPTSPIAAGGQTSFEVTYSPDSVGSHLTSVFIESDDPAVPFYEFDIRGGAVAPTPEIVVEGSGMTIAPGDFTPSLADDTDFGEVATTGPGLTHTFTIRNIGNAALTIVTLDLVNGDPSQFAITSQPASPVANASETTFAVTFSPDTIGSHFTSVSIESNDPDVPVYEFDIQGTAIAGSSIAVEGAGMTIPAGDTTPSPDDDTDFGSSDIGGAGVPRTFTIVNNGPTDLEITSISFVDGEASDFSLTSPAASPITPGGSSTFEVTFQPSASGLRATTLRIESDDADTPTFEFSIQGQGAGFRMLRVERDGNDAIIVFEPSPLPLPFFYLLQESTTLEPDSWINDWNHYLFADGGSGEQSIRVENAFQGSALYWRVVEVPNF